MEVQVKALREALEVLKPVIPRKPSINVLRNVLDCLPPASVMAMVDKLLLQRSPKTIHRRIIETIRHGAAAPHANDENGYSLGKTLKGILEI